MNRFFTKYLNASLVAKVLLLLVFAVLLVAGSAVMSPEQAEAFPQRSALRGYFSNSSYSGNGKRVWSDDWFGYDNPDSSGLYVNTIDEFVEFYEDRINSRYPGSETTQARTAAAFTIHVMLGNPGGSSKGITSAQFNEWERRVRAYARVDRIDFNRNYSFSRNTLYDASNDDVMWYTDNDTRPSVVFLDESNSVVFAIKRDCANPVGGMNELPDQPPISWELRPAIGGRSQGGVDNRQIPSGPYAGQDYNIRYAVAGERIRISGATDKLSDEWPQSRNHTLYMQLTPGYRSYANLNRGITSATRENNSTAYFDGRRVGRAVENAYFDIDSGTPHGTVICLRTGVNNYTGIQPSTVTSTNIRWTGNRCWTVLQRYDIDSVGVADGPDNSGLSPGESGTARIQFSNVGRGASTVRNSGGVTGAVRVAMRLYERTSNTTVGSVDVRSNIAVNASGNATLTFPWAIPSDAEVGDEYCVAARVTNIAGFTAGYITDSSFIRDEVCATISAGPYFGLDEGSVFAGVQLGERAPTATSVLIASSFSTVTGDWIGGVSEFAALALGQISGFSTTTTIAEVSNPSDDAPQRSGGAEQELIDLTFANTPALGNFGSDRYRQTDLYQLYVDPATNNSLNNNQADDLPQLDEVSGQPSIGTTTELLTGGTETAVAGRKVWWVRNNNGTPSNLKLADSSAIDLRGQGGIDVVVLVSGDLWIGNNIIVFDDSGYANIEAIPSLTVIVEGEIHLGSQVTQLDGTYITAGDFNTCDSNSAFGPGNEDHVVLSTGECNEQLTVNGLVLADRFLLKRTYGSTTGANADNTEPAEQFIHAAEVYLSPPPSPFPNLPGVSSLVDLPPLF